MLSSNHNIHSLTHKQLTIRPSYDIVMDMNSTAEPWPVPPLAFLRKAENATRVRV